MCWCLAVTRFWYLHVDTCCAYTCIETCSSRYLHVPWSNGCPPVWARNLRCLCHMHAVLLANAWLTAVCCCCGRSAIQNPRSEFDIVQATIWFMRQVCLAHFCLPRMRSRYNKTTNSSPFGLSCNSSVAFLDITDIACFLHGISLCFHAPNALPCTVPVPLCKACVAGLTSVWLLPTSEIPAWLLLYCILLPGMRMGCQPRWT